MCVRVFVCVWNARERRERDTRVKQIGRPARRRQPLFDSFWRQKLTDCNGCTRKNIKKTYFASHIPSDVAYILP